MGSDARRNQAADDSKQSAESRGTAGVGDSGDSVSDANGGQPTGPLPERFGRYRIIRLLGQGAMGEVYLAHDDQLDRDVALKIPKFSANGDEERIERFYREARSAAKIRHPNLCPVHDVGEIDGRPFLTMAYIAGCPLSEYIRPEKLQPERQAAVIIRKLARGLAVAHQQNIIHRDLKPANIMIDERREPIVMDFGLAQRAREDESRLTKEGAILGTPAYMPPEQVFGEVDTIGPHSDVYSLGVVLYELLTAELPFAGPVIAVLAQVVKAKPEPPSRFRTGLDARLEAICLKAMAKKIEDRYESMDAFAAALTDFLRQQTGHPSEVPTIADVPAAQPGQENDDGNRLSQKSRRFAVAVGVTALLAGLILFLATNNGFNATKNRTPKDKSNGSIVENEGAAKQLPVINRASEAYEGLPGWVISLMFTPNEKSLLTGSVLGHVELWDVLTGKKVRSFPGQSSGIRCASFSTDGRQILAGTVDAVRLWDVESGQVLRVFEGLGPGGVDAAFTPKGLRAVKAFGKNIRLWDLDNNHEIITTKRQKANIARWRYIPKGDRLFSIGLKGAVGIVAIKKKIHIKPLGFHMSPGYCIESSANGRRGISGAADGSVLLWDLVNKKMIRRLEGHTASVHAVALSHDGRWALSGGGLHRNLQLRKNTPDYSIRLWDTETGRQIDSFDGNADVICLAFSPTNQYVAASRADKTVQIWRLPELAE